MTNHRTDGFVFDYGVLSNFSEDHIGGNEHKDMREYLESKRLLFRQCKTGIVNLDDAHRQQLIEGHTCRLETYGFSPEADFRASEEALLSRPGYLGVEFTWIMRGISRGFCGYSREIQRIQCLWRLRYVITLIGSLGRI